MGSRALFVEQECCAFLSSEVILMDSMLLCRACLEKQTEGECHQESGGDFLFHDLFRG